MPSTIRRSAFDIGSSPQVLLLAGHKAFLNQSIYDP